MIYLLRKIKGKIFSLIIGMKPNVKCNGNLIVKKWPIIDVTRRLVEETAASILKIFEISKNK